MVARINRESISTLIVDARPATAGAAEFDRAAARITSANTAAQRITQRTTVMLGEQSKQYRALARQIDPAFAAQDKFTRGLKTLDAQFKGNTGLSEYQRMLGLLRSKWDETTVAAETAAQKQAAALAKMRSRYDPLFAANEKYKAELRDLMEAHAAGAVDEPNFRREHARIDADFNPANISARKLADAQAKLAAEQKKAAEAAKANAREVDLLRAKYDPAFAASLRFRDALEAASRAEAMGALQGAALHREMDRIVSTLHPAAVAARELAEADAKLAQASQEAAEKAAVEARALDQLRAKFDPAFAATQRYKNALLELNKAATQAGLRGKPLADALDRVERELNPLNIALAKSVAAQAALAQRAQAVTERMNPLERAQRLYSEAVREASELHWKGALSLKQYEQAVAHAADTLHHATAVNDEFGQSQSDAARLAARRITQLSPQISDIVTQAMTGTSPFMILMQQGPQIADIWGGIPTLLRAIPPSVYAIGAAFLALGTAAMMTASRMSEISGQARTLESIGRTLNPQVAGMAKELRGLTMAMTTEGVSRGDAMKSIEQLARTRILQAELYASISKVVPDVANALGTDAPGAAKELADAFSQGANGVRALDEKLHFLSPSMLHTIELMDRSGDRIGAMKLAMQELTKTYEGEALKQMSAWERMTTAMGNAWDALWEKIATSPQALAFMRDAAYVADMITSVLRGTGEAAATAGTGIKAATGDVKALSDEIFRLQKEANAAQAEGFRLMDAGDPGADAALERAADLARQMQEAQAKLSAMRGGSPGSGIPDAPTVNGLTDDEQKRVNSARTILDAETEALKRNRVERQISMAGHQAFEAAIASGRSAQEASAMADQARERAIRDLNIAIQDENQALDLNAAQTLKVADGYRHSTLEGLRAIAMRQAMTDQMNTGADAVERANRLLRINAAQSYEQTGKMFDTANLDLANQNDIAKASRGSVSSQRDAERRVEAEKAYRDAINDAAAAHDTQMVAALTAERTAYEGVLAKRDEYARQTNVIAQMRRGFGEDVAMLELEYDLVGKGNVEREREITLLRVRQALIASGATGTALEDELDRLRQIIGLRAEANEKTRRATELFERNRQALMDTADIMRDGFEDAVLNGEKLSDVIKNISRALLQLGMDVVVMAPIKDALNTWMQGGSGGSNPMMTGPITEGAKGSGPWGTLAMLAQTGLNLYAGWSAGTGPSLMPNAANDAGALSAGALKANWSMYPVAHSGWEVGKGSPPAVRAVPQSVFVSAPKFHGGGLLGGERAIIAQDGEEILTANNPRHRRNFRNGGGNTIVMNISTPDANSFRQSQGQVTAAAARSLSLATRRNG